MPDFSKILDAITSGHYMLAGALVVIIIVAALKTDFVTKKFPALKAGKWAWTAAIVTGALMGLANAIIAGAPLGGGKGVVSLIAQGAYTGLVAAGLVKGIKEHAAA